MKRVALYVRVSHEEQVKHGISVDAQISDLTAYSNEHDYTIVKIYNDAGISARKSYKKRPALLNMIKDCQDGKIDLILICKLDRFFRSVPDYYAVMEQIGDIPWKAIHEDYETETSSGVFKVNIMLSVAQSEADRTSERIKKVFEYKRERGEALTGQASTGYVYKDGKWYKDQATMNGVEAFFKTYLLTFNKKIAIERAKEFGVHISDETARHMLYGDNYYGIIPYITEAYITQEEHDLIISNKPICSRNNKYYYIFSGLLRCGKCGRPLSATTSVNIRKNGNKTTHAMYVCDYGRRNYNCEGSAISETKLESILLDSLDKELINYNISIKSNDKNNNLSKIHKYEDRLNRLKVLFELGDIEIEEYKQKKNVILQELDSYKLLDHKQPIHLETNWKEIYSTLDTQHRNAFWKHIIKYIEIPEKRASTVNISFK